jgi:SAM-dependent methyltransferase
MAGPEDNPMSDAHRLALAAVAAYRAGQPRSIALRDLVLAELAQRPRARVLDIGCGRGFDGNTAAQRELIAAAGRYVGVEPDPDIALQPGIAVVHRCLLEQASIPSASIDVAIAAMVLEHVTDPEAFWAAVHRVLVPGGVFWGFTVNADHWFARASALMDRVGLKGWYLTRLRGSRGTERYENYPTAYRCCRVADLTRQTAAFRERLLLPFGRPSQLDFYAPARWRGLSRAVDRGLGRLTHPDALLAVRLEK